MSDDRMDMKLNFDVHVTDLEKAEILRQEIGKMAADLARLGRNANASLKNLAGLGKIRLRGAGQEDTRAAQEALDLDRARMAELNRQFRFKGRMASQQRREESAVAKAEKEQQDARERAYKANLKFNTDIARQRAKEESAAEKAIRDQILETSRLRDREAKKAREEAKRAERDRAKAARDAQAGAQRAPGGVGRIAGIGAGMAAGLSYGGTRMIERGVSTRMDIDSAETSLKIFGDQGGGKKFTSADIKRLRRGPKGLDAEAIRNGVSVKAAIEAFTEVNKAGLIDPLEQTRTLLAGTTALELDPRATTKLMGTMARNMGAAATPARLKQTLNAIAVGAREDPTQAGEIVEGMNRAQGVLAMTKGITEEDLVALVSGGQSVGIQPGKAGTFLPSLARDILKGNDKFLDKGKRKELNYAAKHLGFGSAKNMATQFAGEKGKEVLYQIFGRLKAMDPAMRAQVANALSGGQWSDEDLQVVNGLDGMISTDKAIHDPKNAGFIDQARNEKMKSWAGMWAQSQAIFSLFWESFGVGFDGVLREINAFFLDLNGRFNYDQVSQYVRDALDGLKDGLGLDTWKEGLQAIFPSDISGLGQSIKDFARGFGAGLRSMGETLRSVGSMFGMGGGAETIGNLAAKFFTLSAACIALAPVIGVIGGLGSIVLGIVGMARAAMAVLGGGAGAATGAAGGALAGIARMLAGGFVVGLAGAIGNLRGEISTMILSAVRPLVEAIWTGLKQAFSWQGVKSGGAALLNEIIPAPLRRWLDGDGKPDAKAEGSHWTDPPARTGTSEAPAPEAPVEKLKAEVEKQTQILQRQLEVDQKALDAAQVSRDAKTAATTPTPGADGAITYQQWRTQFEGLHGAQLGRALEAQKDRTGGTPLPAGMRRRGIIGGGGGPGVSVPDSVPMTAQERNQLGLIQKYETGGQNVMNGVGARMGVSPTQAKGYTAQGYYQLLNSNWQRIAPKLGISAPNAMAASHEDQTRVALHLLRNGGIGNWSNFNPKLRAALARGEQISTDGIPNVSPGGAVSAGDGQSVPHLDGKLSIGGRSFDFGSGNGRGYNSIPFGSHEITPNALGPWGRANGAIGIANGQIYDKTLGRMRTGIEMHAVDSAGKITAGCIGIARNQFGVFKQAVLEMIRTQGHAYLNVGADGRASITAQRPIQKAAETARALAEPKMPPKLDGQKLGDLDVAGSGRNLGANAPLSSRSAPAGSGGGGRVGHTFNSPITVNGYNKSPEELAGTVQRHLQDSMNRRTHDFDGFA